MCLVFIQSFANYQNDSCKEVIGVFDFISYGDINSEIVSDCSYKLRKIVAIDNRFIIIDKEQVKKILIANNVNLNQLSKSIESCIKIGNLLKCNKLLIGSIGNIDQGFCIELKLIDVYNAKILDNSSEIIDDKILLLESLEVMTNNILGSEKKSLPKLPKIEKINRKHEPIFSSYNKLTEKNMENQLKEIKLKRIKNELKRNTSKSKIDLIYKDNPDGSIEVFAKLNDKKTRVQSMIKYATYCWNGSDWIEEISPNFMAFINAPENKDRLMNLIKESLRKQSDEVSQNNPDYEYAYTFLEYDNSNKIDVIAEVRNKKTEQSLLII